MRLAFKEREVNSKRTWFSKLFRGGSPTNLGIVSDEVEAGAQASDAELPRSLAGIESTGEIAIAPRPRPVAARRERNPPAESRIPFVERRSVPRLSEEGEYRLAAAAAVPEPASPSMVQPVAESCAQARPPRPLTFHQLAGGMEGDVPHEESNLAHQAFGRADSAPEAPAPLPEASSIVAPVAPVAAAVEPAGNADAGRSYAPPAEPSISSESPGRPPASAGPPPSGRRGGFERTPMIPDPLTDPAPAPRPYRFDTPPGASSTRPVASAPSAAVPGGTSFPPDHAPRLQILRRRKTDYPQGNGETEDPGMTRNWKLLSQFEPVVTDPLPAHRKGYTRSTDFNPPRKHDEG